MYVLYTYIILHSMYTHMYIYYSCNVYNIVSVQILCVANRDFSTHIYVRELNSAGWPYAAGRPSVKGRGTHQDFNGCDLMFMDVHGIDVHRCSYIYIYISYICSSKSSNSHVSIHLHLSKCDVPDIVPTEQENPHVALS